MKKLRSTLALLLVLVLCLSLFPTTAYAEDEIAEDETVLAGDGAPGVPEDGGQLAVDPAEDVSEEIDVDILLKEVDLAANNQLLNSAKGNSVNSHQYSAAQLRINWDHIRSVGHQSSGQACACFSYAYMRTILDGRVHYWTEFNSSSGSNQGTAIAPWQGSTWSGYFPSDKNAAFERLYSEINNGKPAAVKVTGSRSSHHYVAVVGFVNVTSSSLSANNFLIIDPCASQFVVENMGGVGYDIKIEEGVYQVTYDTTSQTVGFESSTGSSNYLDLNGYLDGNSVGNISGYGTVDVYINGSLDEPGVSDYYKAWPAGTTYEFRNIQPTAGHFFTSVYSGSVSGTIGSSAVTTVLEFNTGYTITYKKDSGDVVRQLAAGTQTVEFRMYDQRNGEYFSGFSYSPNAEVFDVRPGDHINLTENITLYPVYISHAEAISGQPVLICNISDFPSSGYATVPTTVDITRTTTESHWGSWSNWSTTAVSASDTRQVETTAMYRYYYFYCPVCGGHEPFTGTSDCGQYSLSGSDWHEKWSTTPYSQSSYQTFSYTSSKYYTTSLGDGQIWCFSAGNLHDTAVGTIDATGSAVVITTGYRYRDLVTTTSTTTVTTDAWIIYPLNYTVSYNANGGTGAPASQTKTHDVTLVLTSVTPTRANSSAGSYTVTLNANGGSVSQSSLTAARTTSYSFRNWNTAQNGSGTSYNPGANYTVNADVTLYAQWNSSTSTASVNLPTPSREGYTFKGWATSANAASGVTGSYTPTGNVTLYATWELSGYSRTLTIPASTTEIGSEAFANLTQGVNVVIPASVQYIAADAFRNSRVVIIAEAGSYAAWWANRYSVPCIIGN